MAWYCPDCGKGGENIRGPAGHYCPAVGAFVAGVMPSGPKPEPISEGPGTELEKLLAMFQVEQIDGCKCREMRNRMNQLGPDGCERELDRIVVSLQAEAKRRKWWFAESVIAKATAEMLVKRSIRNARGVG